MYDNISNSHGVFRSYCLGNLLVVSANRFAQKRQYFDSSCEKICLLATSPFISAT